MEKQTIPVINGTRMSKTFGELERICEYNFKEAQREYGHFWHVCTPGHLSEILNISEDDFKFAVSNVAISAYESGLVVITDAQMSNHLHAILGGPLEQCFVFIDSFRFRLAKHIQETGRIVDLSRFECKDPIQITDLEMMRKEVAYVNRNGFVADRRYLPFTYPWGSGHLYFNTVASKATGTPYNDAPFKEKRRLCCRRVVEMPENYMISDGMILPSSYADYKLGESFFRDAHHYLNEVTKKVESYSASAQRLGDKTVLGAEEMYYAVKTICEREYNISQPAMIAPSDKITLANTMKFKYHASNAQIRMILKLSEQEVDSLFPHP